MKQKILFIITCIVLTAVHLRGQFSYDFAFGLGENADDQGYKITSDNQGNIYCIGLHTYWMNLNPLGTQYIIQPGPLAGYGADVYVAKYNAQGILDWGFNLGNNYGVEALGIAVDADNNVYITGYFSDTLIFGSGTADSIQKVSNGGNDIFLAKYDANGNFQWVRTMGGTGDDQPWDLSFDPISNDVIITGAFISTSMDMDSGTGQHVILNTSDTLLGGNACFVAAYSLSGAYQWAFSIAGWGGAVGSALAVDDSGNIYLGGQLGGVAGLDSTNFNPGQGKYWVYNDYNGAKFIAKYTDTGGIVWANALNGEGGITAAGLACDKSGNVYQSGYFNASLAPGDSLNFNPDSSWWMRTTGTQAGYVAKYNAHNGSFEWAFELESNWSDVAQNIAFDGNGHLFVTGAFGDSVDFDPGPGVHILYGYPSSAFLAEYDTGGHYIDAIGFTGRNGSQYAVSICAVGQNRVGITGFFSADTINFGVPGGPVHNLEVNGQNPIYTDAFVAVYFTNSDTTLGIQQITSKTGMKIFPNPTNGMLNILYQGDGGLDEISITDMLGRNIYQYAEQSFNALMHQQIDCSKMEAGIYLVSVKTESGVETEKFVKQ